MDPFTLQFLPRDRKNRFNATLSEVPNTYAAGG